MCKYLLILSFYNMFRICNLTISETKGEKNDNFPFIFDNANLFFLFFELSAMSTDNRTEY